jgi:prepilin-type N-terminal cleavage/methylation domain-containing protein
MRIHDLEKNKRTSGFSLLELIIAMTITLVVMGVAAHLLARSFHVRAREEDRTDAIADVQRALNVMSREIAMGGFGFDGSSNGLVAGDCTASTIRVRSNLNRYTDEGTKYTISTAGEDIKYEIDNADNTEYLVRFDQFAAGGARKSVLANRVDSLSITYLDASNAVLNVTATPSLVANAARVRITVSVTLEAVGTPKSPGYQPAWPVQLTSDIALRNTQETLNSY